MPVIQFEQRMKLILASSSPQRAAVLRNAGFVFEVVPAHVDESPREGETAGDLVRRLAETKARVVAAGLPQASHPAIVVGTDTVIFVEGLILGKPVDAQNAREMLRRLSGRTHEVITGLAVLSWPKEERRVEQESTRVTFATLRENEIEDYIASGEPLDKAGAYGIQGLGGRFVERVEGCYFNVVGLPLARLYRIVREMEWSRAVAER
jgi:septum formation protein